MTFRLTKIWLFNFMFIKSLTVSEQASHYSFLKTILFFWGGQNGEKFCLYQLSVQWSSSRYEPNTHFHVAQKLTVKWSLFHQNRKKGGCQILLGCTVDPEHFFLPVLLPRLPLSPLTRLLSQKAADRNCHFASALCSTQTETGSVSPWPLAALQPSLVPVLFLKRYIRITPESIYQSWDEKSYWCDTDKMVASR